MDMEEDWCGSRRYVAEKRIQKLLTSDLEESSRQDFSLVNELLESWKHKILFTPLDKTLPLLLTFF